MNKYSYMSTALAFAFGLLLTKVGVTFMDPIFWLFIVLFVVNGIVCRYEEREYNKQG